MHIMDNFPQVSVIRHIKSGWEPFDNHNCGDMSPTHLEQCLQMIFGDGQVDIEGLNDIYTKTAKRPLRPFSRDNVVGFKMRFVPPDTDLPVIGKARFVRRIKMRRYIGYPLRRLGHVIHDSRFQEMTIKVLREYNVVVFFAARQDVLRWGLSKYHGNGFGKPGHLQFKLANGRLKREDIPSIRVDCRRLERVITHCESIHQRKKMFIKRFRSLGIDAYPVLYEDFVADPHGFFGLLFDYLETPVSDDDISSAIDTGSPYEKVHADDIADFVMNHEEVLERFRGRFVPYESAMR